LIATVKEVRNFKLNPAAIREVVVRCPLLPRGWRHSRREFKPMFIANGACERISFNPVDVQLLTSEKWVIFSTQTICARLLMRFIIAHWQFTVKISP
jgi:hypothetical protein